MELPITENCQTIQGEGRYVGLPISLLRIHDCDIGCSYCNHKMTWSPTNKFSLQTLEHISRVLNNRKNVVLITGGEPLLNQEGILELKKLCPLEFHLETSGYYSAIPNFYEAFDFVTISPKLHLLNQEYYNRIFLGIGRCKDFCIKIVVKSREDIDKAVSYNFPNFYVQIDSYMHARNNRQVVFLINYIIRNYPKLMVSPQVHLFYNME